MVNHVRTLLLNMLPEVVGTTPGEEYVPRDYKPVNLPADLRAASAALFGVGADRAGKNLQLLRITGYLHTSSLAEYVTETDSRLTYRPDRPASVFDRLGATVTNVSGSEAVGWSGRATFGAQGRAYGSWNVTTDGAGGYTVTTVGGEPRAGFVTESDAGDIVPLFGSGLSLVVGTGADGEWAASLLTVPEYNFAAAAERGDPDAVFRPERSTSESAWATAWAESPTAATRAVAFALALAARTYDVMTGNTY